MQFIFSVYQQISNVVARNPFQITTAIATAATVFNVSETNLEGASKECGSQHNSENSALQQSSAKVCLLGMLNMAQKDYLVWWVQYKTQIFVYTFFQQCDFDGHKSPNSNCREAQGTSISNSAEYVSPNRNNNGGHFDLASCQQKEHNVDYEIHQAKLFDKRNDYRKGIMKKISLRVSSNDMKS